MNVPVTGPIAPGQVRRHTSVEADQAKDLKVRLVGALLSFFSSRISCTSETVSSPGLTH
jgi:hypothetical protein